MPLYTVAFIGLGTMGFPMAGYLANAGHHVIVYNRTYKKTHKWLEHYTGQYAKTPKTAAENADIVIICVGNDNDLHDVCLGENGITHTIKANTLVIDHTTVSAKITRTLSQHFKEKHVHFIDAPVSGGQAGAENGCLTIMCGGSPEQFERAKPIMDHYSQSCLLMGDSGSGQLTKMVNQISAVGVIQGLAEGMAFAQNSGLDCEKVYKAISQGAAGSWQMSHRHQSMLADKFDHGFAIDWMRKDLAICLEEAQANGSQLPITQLIDQFYQEVQEMGGGRWDTSALLKRLPQNTHKN